MAAIGQHLTSERMRAATAVAVLNALIGFALVTGLGVEVSREAVERLKVFAVPVPPPPPEASRPDPVRRKGPEGAAAPPSLRADPAPVVAPRRGTRSPIAAVPEKSPTGEGSATKAGASERPGPGSGAGGEGSGTGAGRFGSGTGGGGTTRAQRIAGSLSYADYPGRGRDQVETVSVRFTVGPDGRVGGCRVTGSSGNGRLDAATCRLIEQRFRYRPALADGEPVPSIVGTTFDWVPPSRRRR